MSAVNATGERRTGWLTGLLALAAPAGYSLVWSLLSGSDGCGPVGHSTLGRIFSAAPFVLPFVAAGILIAIGIARGWRRGTLAWAATAVVAIGGMLEAFVFLIEFGVRRCGE